MTVIEKYKTELDLVRRNFKLLDNYRFDKDALNSKHFDRLRLNIAIYNDLKQADYEIVKFLFMEEKEWRKYGKDGKVDNLYFCAFILTLFNSPEIVWLFFETKNIDFDSGIGFDGEYLVSAGIKETYEYLETVDNPKKTELLKYIGETEENCIYSQAEIDDWKENKKIYFKNYKFPIQDELYFLYSTNERELFLTKLPEWINQERAWTCEELGLYRTYTKYADDKALEIEAFKMTLKKNDKGFLTETYNRQLAGLYIEIGENDKSFEILEGVIKRTNNKNIVRDCVEQLCRIIIKTNNSSDETSKKSLNIIKIQQKKYRNFSPMVDNLIKDVTEIMKDESLDNRLKAEPVRIQERIEVLDIIRGFALLGILIANMAWYNSPALYSEILGKSMQAGFWDTMTSSFINIFVQGKFYSIFSFLFGLGFAIFFERAKAKTTRPKLLYYRRLLILLFIGLIHAFFIWFGDILVTYALLGFLLPPFFNRKPKTLLKWAVSLFSIFILFIALAMGLLDLVKTMLPEEDFAKMIQPFFSNIEKGIESSLHIYSQGTFAEIMAQRSSDFFSAFGQVFSGIFMIFPLFLLGLYAGKRGIFQNMEENQVLIKKTWVWSLVIGLTMSVVKFIFKKLMGIDLFSFNTAIYTGAGVLGDTGLCLFFITSIILLYQNRKWKIKLKPLSYMGRMALSNYLLQSIICTTIFYSYGLGLYGKVGLALGFVLSIVIFIIQIFISKYWFRYYQFGPVEWIWRSLTYGKFFKIKWAKNKDDDDK